MSITIIIIIILLHRQQCFTRKYLVKLHPGPEWFIFHNLTHEFSDDDDSAVLNFPWEFVSYFSDVFLSV